MDMPEITTYVVEDPDPNGPFGAKEVGQGPLLPIMPALCNAIFDAVGVRVDQVPVSPHMILKAMQEKKAGRDPRFGPKRFPEIDYGTPIVVPTPDQGGDGTATNLEEVRHQRKTETMPDQGKGGAVVMMRLPRFEYVAAKSLEEVTLRLADDPMDTRLVAGGTDLWPNMKRRHQHAKTLVSLSRVESVRGIEGDSSCEMRIGAGTTLTEICEDAAVLSAYPGLAQAVASISTPVLRNMGTIGGNLCLDTRCTYYNQTQEWRESISFCMKEAGQTCWVAPKSARCWAISASDSAPLLCALGARVRLVSAKGERVIPLPELFAEDGIAYLTRERDEVLTDVLLPAAPGLRSTYWKLRRRGSIDFPVLGVGTALRLDGDRVSDVRIYLGAVVSAPARVEAAEEVLRGERLDPERIAEAAKRARRVATPLGNTDFEIPWRHRMVEMYVEGTLRELAGLAPSTRIPPHGRHVLGA